MDVRLLIHGEPADGEGRLVWWVESPDVPGFSGAADHLLEARITSERAIRDLFEEQGVHEPIAFTYDLVSTVFSDEGVLVGRTGDAPAESASSGDRAEVARVA